MYEITNRLQSVWYTLYSIQYTICHLLSICFVCVSGFQLSDWFNQKLPKNLRIFKITIEKWEIEKQHIKVEIVTESCIKENRPAGPRWDW